MIMTAVKIPDRERSRFMIFRTEIGEHIVGDALNSELLYKSCVEHGDAKGSLKLIVVSRSSLKGMSRVQSQFEDVRPPSQLRLSPLNQASPGTGLPTPSPSPGPGPDSSRATPADVAIQARVPRTAVSRLPRADSNFTKTTAASTSEYQLSVDERRLTPQPLANISDMRSPKWLEERFEYENRSVASTSSVAQMDAEIRATKVAKGSTPENPVSRSAIAVLHFERNIAPCDVCGRHFAGLYTLEKHCMCAAWPSSSALTLSIVQSQGGRCTNPDLATELHRLELEDRPMTEMTNETPAAETPVRTTPKAMPPLLSRVNTDKALPAPPRPPRGDSVDGPGPVGWSPVTPPTTTKVLNKSVDASTLKKLTRKLANDNEFRGGPKSRI
ncbi:hypothetical protein FRC08_007309 [Ceratobasidium sp. 394]|nr:hypothetical protein FRC08_007309 [Ceratobasidium sp. 394]